MGSRAIPREAGLAMAARAARVLNRLFSDFVTRGRRFRSTAVTIPLAALERPSIDASTPAVSP